MRRADTQQREEAHHDIFCFPTQMAMSSAVRALLSSVQVGEGEPAGARRGTLDWIGCDARTPEMCYQWLSRRFNMMILSGWAAGPVSSWLQIEKGGKQVGDGTEVRCDEARCDARSVRVGLLLRSEVFRVSDLEYVSPGGFDSGAALQCDAAEGRMMMRGACALVRAGKGEQGQQSRLQSRCWLDKSR